MSWQPTPDPKPGDAYSCDAIEQVIVPRSRDLGGFEVRRALPAAGKQMVGPFIFFDEFGPAEFLIGTGIDVRPHPHIGLATVTYLFDGEIMHRDSLGTELSIRPGELNLMSAGRGIVHSERTSAEERAEGPRLFGIQAWRRCPNRTRRGPTFAHHAAADLPRISGEGKTVRLILGSMCGERSPAAFPHESFYAEAVLAPGALLPLGTPTTRNAPVYMVSGEIDIAGQVFGPGRLLVFRPGDRISILALSQARPHASAGSPRMGRSHLVELRLLLRDRIAAAKADWKAKRFEPVLHDVEEFIPLPE